MSRILLKLAEITLPVRLTQTRRRPVRWQAGLYDSDLQPLLTAEAATPTDAREALAARTAEALVLMDLKPILVIGGGPDYESCLHVINPEPDGCVVYTIRDGYRTSSWYSKHSRAHLLAEVLDHVSGTPTVIHL
ncbi:hypothetical protein [Actinoplanes sp. RD1]|uniref:hypothetical protein n=1 Tax=Actinoplanes sp. RD1 TaxID=3064538 RepID=UPI0027426D6F|nr:hypothetical protein [Actinoplanes sp. RD1]